MEAHYCKGVIGIKWKFFPGGIIMKPHALYLFASAQDNSQYTDIGRASGGLAGGVLVSLGARVANLINERRYDKIPNGIAMHDGDIKDGLNESVIQVLQDVAQYIKIEKNDIKKITQFNSRVNFFHRSGLKYSFTVHQPKDKKKLLAVIHEWYKLD